MEAWLLPIASSLLRTPVKRMGGTHYPTLPRAGDMNGRPELGTRIDVLNGRMWVSQTSVRSANSKASSTSTPK